MWSSGGKKTLHLQHYAPYVIYYSTESRACSPDVNWAAIKSKSLGGPDTSSLRQTVVENPGNPCLAQDFRGCLVTLAYNKSALMG